MARRPNRGRHPGRNVLVTGDTGPRQPQGGAKPGATESGDLAAREFGVPQADIDGGVRHLVNPQTHPQRPAGVPERGADVHKYHGVPSGNGMYVTPPTQADDTGFPRPEPEPKSMAEMAVPVYIEERPGKRPKIRTFTSRGLFTMATNDNTPRRIADRDPDRVWLMIYNTNNVLIGTEAELWTAVNLAIESGATVPTGAGGGFLLTQGAAQGNKLDIQDELWLVNASTSATPSFDVGYCTEIEAAEGS